MPWFHTERRGLIRADVFSFHLEQVEYAHKKPLLTSKLATQAHPGASGQTDISKGHSAHPKTFTKAREISRTPAPLLTLALPPQLTTRSRSIYDNSPTNQQDEPFL